jgi:hypothetical protein
VDFVDVLNIMNNPRLRFTAQEKLAIMEEIEQKGLEPTLQKHHLSVDTLTRWQKTFKTSNASSSIRLAESLKSRIANLDKEPPHRDPLEDPAGKPENAAAKEKEEAFLRLVASLIVECVLEKDTLDR